MPLEEDKSINVNLHIVKNEVTRTPELMHLEEDNSGKVNPHGVDKIEVAEENSVSEVAQIEASSTGNEEHSVGPAHFLSSASILLKDAATLLILGSSTLRDVGHLLKQAGSSMIAAGFPYMAPGYSLMAAGVSLIGDPTVSTAESATVSTAQICAAVSTGEIPVAVAKIQSEDGLSMDFNMLFEDSSHLDACKIVSPPLSDEVSQHAEVSSPSSDELVVGSPKSLPHLYQIFGKH